MTAVEQLVSNIRALAYDKRHHLGMGDIRITQGLLDELEEQAKEMEKEKEKQYNNMLSMLQETYRRLEPLGTISLRKQIKEVLTFKSE